MKDQRRKYLIVPANEIVVTLRKHQRVSGFNDFWNEYVPYDSTSAKTFFEAEQVPEQYQKIVFALPTCPCCKSNGKEILTGRQFTIVKEKTSKEYFGEECGRWYDGDVIGGSITFDVPRKKSSYNDILSFYEELTENGYLDQYVSAINNMFYLKNELAFNGEQTKVEDKAKELLKTKQNKKAS